METRQANTSIHIDPDMKRKAKIRAIEQQMTLSKYINRLIFADLNPTK